jgi:hypothetical protein
MPCGRSGTISTADVLPKRTGFKQPGRRYTFACQVGSESLYLVFGAELYNGRSDRLRELWQDVWQNLRPWLPIEAWREFPPPQRLLTILTLSLLCIHLFVQDHHKDGGRYF